MSRSGDHYFGPSQPGLSQAQEAVAFSQVNEPALPIESEATVLTLHDAVRDLLFDRQYVDNSWDGLVTFMDDNSGIMGRATKQFEDGSSVHVIMRKFDACTQPVDYKDELFVSIRTHHPSDRTKTSFVSYQVRGGDTVLTRETDEVLSPKVYDELFKQFESVDGETGLDRLIGSLVSDALLAEAGLDPDVDADVLAMRLNNDFSPEDVLGVYREEMSAYLLEQDADGPGQPYLTGIDETRKLIAFLKSL